MKLTITRICIIALLSLLTTGFLRSQDTINGIAWYSPIQITPDTEYNAFLPSIAVQGDTVHISWIGSSERLPYARSVDGGKTFSQERTILHSSFYRQGGPSWLVSAGKRLHMFFGGQKFFRGYFALYHMKSDDRGDTWSYPYDFADTTSNHSLYFANNDTLAFICSPCDTNRRYDHIIFSTDGGDHWKTRPYIIMANSPNVAITNGIMHLVKGYRYDSAGHVSWHVIQYRKSTDMGITWSDSIPLSTVSSAGADYAFMTAYPDGDSSKIFTMWRDGKYGCLTGFGCGIAGRVSSDNGMTFDSEHRFDQRPSGAHPQAVMGEKIITVTWLDDIPFGAGPFVISVSSDGGSNWTPPYPLGYNTEGAVAVSGNTIHAVMTEITGPDPQEGRTKIVYRKGVVLPAPKTIYVTMDPEWNLISLPMRLPTSRAHLMFPFAVSRAYGFRQEYIPVDTLTAGNGYWLKFDKYNRTVSHSGEPLLTDTLDVTAGWNLIGSLSSPVPTGGIKTIPDSIIRSDFTAYWGGYFPVSVLSSGKGYWVNVSQNGKLILNVSSSQTPGTAMKDPPTTLNVLTIRDAAGRSQKLYFGKERAGGFWEMPPPPPAGAFDCRFASGKIAEFFSGEGVNGIITPREFPILLSSPELPVTISWKCKPGAIASSLNIGGYDIPLEGEGSTQIFNGKLPVVLKFGIVSEVPKTFTLLQNYPNPFNPATRIRFTLPAAGLTTLKIYDVFGKEIKTLVNGRMDAGEHDAEWNATGTASGVYFYRLSWRDPFNGVKQFAKKMILIK